jgi:hypothetical protein
LLLHGGPLGDVHHACVEVDQHGARRHGALGCWLAWVGMAADRIGRAAMVGRRRAHVLKGYGPVMRTKQFAHAVDTVERVGGKLLHQGFTVTRCQKMI